MMNLENYGGFGDNGRFGKKVVGLQKIKVDLGKMWWILGKSMVNF